MNLPRLLLEPLIGSTSGGKTRLGPGIDTRGPGGGGRGGYVVGPGSVVDGVPYVVVRDVPVAELPGWLTELLGTPDHRRPVVG